MQNLIIALTVIDLIALAFRLYFVARKVVDTGMSVRAHKATMAQGRTEHDARIARAAARKAQAENERKAWA